MACDFGPARLPRVYPMNDAPVMCVICVHRALTQRVAFGKHACELLFVGQLFVPDIVKKCNVDLT